MKKLVFVGIVGLALVGCDESKAQKQNVPVDCDGLTITDKSYEVIGSGNNIYSRNGDEFNEVNTISYEIPVIEKCLFNDYSYIVPQEERWKTSKSGWVKTSILDKGQELSDPYMRHIDTMVTSYQYQPDDFEELSNLLGKDFSKVNSLRYLAAKTVVDSGKCNYVTDSNIDPFNMGTKDNLRFIVECKDRSRISIDEKTIKGGGTIKTDLEKAIPQNIAIEKCNNLIKQKANKYGDVDLYSLTGTNYDVNKTNGNATVDVLFDVKNKLGIVDKYKATCLFTSGSWNEEIVIHERR